MQTQAHTSRQAALNFFFPAFLLLFNLVTRALYLTAQDIGHDEPFSAYHAQFDGVTLINQLKAYNNPPLFELLLHAWIKIFGISPTALRLLPMLIAALAPLCLYYFTRRFFSVSLGVVASLLLSCSTLLQYYAHDCRVYSLFLLLSILSMHSFLALLHAEKRKLLNIAAFILVNALLIYAHYFGAFILLLQLLHLLLFYRKDLWRFIGYYLALTLLYVPQLHTLISRMSYSVKNGTWLEAPVGAESLYNMLWAFSNMPVVTVLCLILLLIALVMGLRRFAALRQHKNLVLILSWFLLPFFGMFFVSFRVPMYISRYLIFALPAYYILLPLCMQSLVQKPALQKAALGVLVACFAASLKLNPDKKQHAGELMDLMQQYRAPGGFVAVFPKEYLPAFAYHYNRAYFSAIADHKEYHQADSLLKHDGIYLLDSRQELDSCPFQNSPQLICITTDGRYQAMPAELEKKYTLLYYKHLGNNTSFYLFRLTRDIRSEY